MMNRRALDQAQLIDSTPPDGSGAAEDDVNQLRAALAESVARERALSLELQHRVRNVLSVIRSIYRRSRESGASPEDFAEHFEGRLDAVARYQSHFDGETALGFDLEDIVRNELLEARCLDGPNCSIHGPVVRVPQKTAELLGLALHELTTNAIKFGALGQDGKLAIEWSVRPGQPPLLDFRWVETGVSVAAVAPRPSGFGQQFIEEALPYQLGAETSLEFRAGGIACSITLPLTSSSAGNATADAPPIEKEDAS